VVTNDLMRKHHRFTILFLLLLEVVGVEMILSNGAITSSEKEK